jgi:hypothetical protein
MDMVDSFNLISVGIWSGVDMRKEYGLKSECLG